MESELIKKLDELGTFAELLRADPDRTKFVKKDNLLDLEGIAADGESHLEQLKKRFSKLPHRVADAVMQFTADAYLSYLDCEFVKTQSESNMVYSPDSLINTVRKLTLELDNLGQVTRFYEKLGEGLEKSKRFVYKLIVADIPKIFSQVKEREDYSRENFGAFVLEVIERATYLTREGNADKGTTFRKKFAELVGHYFPDSSLRIDNGATKALDMDILEQYAGMGVLAGARAMQNDYGEIINAKWRSISDGRNRHISLSFIPADSGSHNNSYIAYKSNVNLEGVMAPPTIKSFLIAMGEIASANLRKRGIRDTQLTETAAYIRNVGKYL